MLLDQPPASRHSDYATADLKEIVEDGIRQRGVNATAEQVHDLVFVPLWRLGVHRLCQLFEPRVDDESSTRTNVQTCVNSRPDAPESSEHAPTTRPEPAPFSTNDTVVSATPNPTLSRALIPTATTAPTHRLISWLQLKTRHPQADETTHRALRMVQSIVCTLQHTQDVTVFKAAFNCYNIVAPYLDLSTRQVAAAYACPGMATEERHQQWRHHVCPPQSTRRSRTVSERMARILRLDSISACRPQPSRGDTPPSDPSLYIIFWGPSWLIDAKQRHFLTTKASMHICEQLGASPDSVMCKGVSVPKWSSVTWHPTVECAAHVNHLWPLQAWAFNAATQKRLMWSGDRLIDAIHHSQGVDARASLQPTPQSQVLADRVVISAREVNPDADITASDGTQLVLDTAGDTVGCYDAAGHLAGRITLHRLHYLERCWRNQQETSTAQHHKYATLPDAVFAAMTTQGIHRAPPHTGQRSLRRWQPSTSVLVAMQDTLKLEKTWFSSPFSVCTLLPMRATAHSADAAFGAVHNAYAFKWTGSGIFNPPNSPLAASKAMRWALQSTTEQTPVLNVGLIPEHRNMGDIDRFTANDRVHQLCRIARKSTLGSHPECWYNDRPAPFKNDHTIRVMLIFNRAGITHLRPDALQTLHDALLSAGAQLLDWNVHLPDTNIPLAAPKLAARYKMANLPPGGANYELPPPPALDSRLLSGRGAGQIVQHNPPSQVLGSRRPTTRRQTAQTSGPPRQTVVHQDDAPALVPYTSDTHPHACTMPLIDTHNKVDAPQENSFKDDDESNAAPPLRRSKRIRTMASSQQDGDAPRTTARAAQTQRSVRQSNRIRAMASSHHNGTTTRCTANTSPAQTPRPVVHSKHSPPRASRKRRPSEPLHINLQRPRTRQRTIETQPSLLHACIMESASERHSNNASPNTPSGMPFDRG